MRFLYQNKWHFLRRVTIPDCTCGKLSVSSKQNQNVGASNLFDWLRGFVNNSSNPLMAE